MKSTPERRAYMRAYYLEHREVHLAQAKARYKRQPPLTEEQRKRRRLAVRKWMAKHQTEYKKRRREKFAGRPMPQQCEVCGRRNGRHGGIALDHCHKTGVFRGWICFSCNTILGHCADNPEILRKLIDYLTVPSVARRSGSCSTSPDTAGSAPFDS
jgi:Recombination endonuclease VII